MTTLDISPYSFGTRSVTVDRGVRIQADDFPTVYLSDVGAAAVGGGLWRDAADVVSWMRTAADAIEARTA